MKILALDPSGNFEEGKGTTGYCVGDEYGNIRTAGQIPAKKYNTQIDYWNAVLKLIKKVNPSVIVCEDYRLYQTAAEAQINSKMETVQLIGLIKWFVGGGVINIPITMQMAHEVKLRWPDELLKEKGFFFNLHVSNHSKDAIRHYVHYITFKIKDKKQKTYKKTTVTANYKAGEEE